MSRLQEYIAIIGSFQGCLLFFLLAVDGRLASASRILGLLCLLIASVLSMPFLLAASDNTVVAIAAGWVFYLPAAAGALAYLYCRSALLDRPFSRRDLRFFAPWVVCYLMTADVFLGDPQEMVEWIKGAAPRTWRLQFSEYLLFAQAFAYAGVTVAMIWGYRRRANDTLANFNPAVFRWMVLLQVVTIVVWVLKALPALSPASIIYSDIANLILMILVYCIALAQWRHPQLFTIPRLAEETNPPLPTAAHPQAGDGELDPSVRAELLAVVTNAVEERRLYLDSALTLSDLAAATGLSKHQVSETLNRQAGKNFYEFINHYRIAHVCERLRSNRTDKVIDIALDAGFASKSTFNAIFKQFTGHTPTQYRRSLGSQPSD